MIEPYTLPSLSAGDVLASSGTHVLIDARKRAARAASGRTIMGARIVDPLAFGHADAAALAREIAGGRIVVFCVHGHEVSQFLVALLIVHGADARYVQGGFEALAVAGAPMETLGT